VIDTLATFQEEWAANIDTVPNTIDLNHPCRAFPTQCFRIVKYWGDSSYCFCQACPFTINCFHLLKAMDLCRTHQSQSQFNAYFYHQWWSCRPHFCLALSWTYFILTQCDNHISAGQISALTLTFSLIITMEPTDWINFHGCHRLLHTYAEFSPTLVLLWKNKFS